MAMDDQPDPQNSGGTLTESRSGRRAWWDAVTRERSVVIMSGVVVVALIAMVWITRRAQLDLIESAALREAAGYSSSLTDFRTLYTSEVASRLGEHGIEITHDYAEKEGAIPLPATLTMLLGDRITERSTGGYVRLYSDYPFPWRKEGGPRDDFQWEALRRLKQDPESPFFAYDVLEGRQVLRYATADVMRKSCVECHNTHPESPKRNWRVGDLRGVLEVALPLDETISQANASLAGIFVLLLALGIGSLGTLAFTARRLRSQVREAQRSAERLGRYTLEEKIGEGGMGQVYRARHAMLRRPTALKVLRRDRMTAESTQRFEREVQLTSQLTHPNTIAIYDYGETPQGDFYYAMEYLEGIPLDRLVREYGPVGEARTVHVLRQICDSLAEAHEAGLIHRDIKPANIMLCRRGGISDVVKVLDFGLVKDVGMNSPDLQLTAANMITGTPLYLSPEVVNAPDEVDARTDLYQVASVGYYLLTGRPVFEGRTAIEICFHHVSTKPVPPSERLGSPISQDLEALILRGLSKKKEDRPKDAREMGSDLALCSGAGQWTRRDADDWWALHQKG